MSARLYIADLRRLDEGARLPTGFPERYQRRLEHCPHAAGRRQLIGGALLLAAALGADIGARLRYDERGKPYAESGPRFNLSHSGRLLALAVADAAVGVDIEQYRALDYLRLARRCFSAGELELLEQAADKQAAFFALWTLRESYVKSRGLALPWGNTCFEVYTDAARQPQARLNGCSFFRYQHIPGYALALCLQADNAAPPVLQYIDVGA
ncbi:MAG: 4'-phosphopantetheinyl transferase superfamily protein [Bacillota bacterium]|nr:4'-phosphopantetheinyl transferase superfamily protein [Bacillota bacterium]